MEKLLRIGIIGDFNPESRSHIPTNESLKQAVNCLSTNLDIVWLPTKPLAEKQWESKLRKFHGFWAAPGQPESHQGIQNAIRFSRERDIPFIGT
ncbi:MAG: hypothetical protein GY866_03395 [Proteobacteria bacterium]|nr:hypothetical protein [Pseudomonadota bacterium]